jgi:hypothetical protein
VAGLPAGLYKFVFKDKNGRRKSGKLAVAH